MVTSTRGRACSRVHAIQRRRERLIATVRPELARATVRATGAVGKQERAPVTLADAARQHARARASDARGSPRSQPPRIRRPPPGREVAAVEQWPSVRLRGSRRSRPLNSRRPSFAVRAALVMSWLHSTAWRSASDSARPRRRSRRARVDDPRAARWQRRWPRAARPRCASATAIGQGEASPSPALHLGGVQSSPVQMISAPLAPGRELGSRTGPPAPGAPPPSALAARSPWAAAAGCSRPRKLGGTGGWRRSAPR